MFKDRRIFFLFLSLILVGLACNAPLNAIGNQNVGTNNEESFALAETPIPELPPATLAAPTTQATETQITPTEIPTEIPTEEIVESCKNDSEFIADVTIPDGTLLEAGVEITKTWRIQNDGDCTWTTDYEWVQIGGDVLLANQTRTSLSQEVGPGEFYEISVVLVLSPGAIEGEEYRAQFQMHSGENVSFGTYPYALVVASSGSGVCPLVNINYLTYLSVDHGFCVNYPESYSMNDVFSDPNRVGVSFAAPYPGIGLEEVVTTLGIHVEGSAAGQSSLEFAELKVEEWKIAGTFPSLTLIDLDGTDGYFTDNLPGMFWNRMIFTVHDETAYVMVFMPMDGAFLEQTAETGEFFDLVLSSFTWIDP